MEELKLIDDLANFIGSKMVFPHNNDELWKQAKQNAIPPIKGKLTFGKIRWRGIKLAGTRNYDWIEQRGKIITDIKPRRSNIIFTDKIKML